MPHSTRTTSSMSRTQPLLANEINNVGTLSHPRRSPSPLLSLSDSAPPSPSSRVSSFGSTLSYSTQLSLPTFLLFYLLSAAAFTCTFFLHSSVLYYATLVPVYGLTSIIAAVGLHRRSSSFLRPSLISHCVLTACLLFLTVCTAIDYTHKCYSRTDYTDRSLSLARTFDCEYDGVVGVLIWNGLAIGAVLLQAALVLLLVGVSRRALMHVVVEDVGLVVVSFCIAGLASVALCGMTLILTFSAHETLGGSSSPASHTATNLTCPTANGLSNYASPPTFPLLFTTLPQANDLGCCTHLPTATNCCRQPACLYKSTYSSSLVDGRSGACHDMLGLLSCAPCDGGGGSGEWASGGWDGMRVSGSFCGRLYAACVGGMNGTSEASEWCTSELRVQVVAGNGTAGDTGESGSMESYNGAGTVRSAARILLFLLPLFVLMLISTS